MCLQSMSPVSLDSATELRCMTCAGIVFARLSSMHVSFVTHIVVIRVTATCYVDWLK